MTNQRDPTSDRADEIQEQHGLIRRTLVRGGEAIAALTIVLLFFLVFVGIISFSFPQAISSVSVYGEGRTITPSGATFTDSFAPLEVHIYEVRF